VSAWLPHEIQTLTRLRDGFIAGCAGATDYWQSTEDLALYDRTFAQRIGWKWEAVLGELSLRGWKPSSELLVDWGCGSGIATRTVLAHWPGQFGRVHLLDRSPMAHAYAAGQLRACAPEVVPRVGDVDAALAEGALLLLSHVLTELSEAQLGRLLTQAAAATAFIWVESATHSNARRLMEMIRDKLLATGQWRAVAPCTHSEKCPMVQPEHSRHWCHHFARVPSDAHQNREWRELSTKLGLDLRVLPYSFLVMERSGGSAPSEGAAAGLSRVIGEPREFKGHLKVLSCGEDGLSEKVLQKRDAPALFKTVRAAEALPVYAWEEKDGRIVGGRGMGERHGTSESPD
jgi:ribosomal protein RSM22 (predicted rRNA methylase)